MATSNTDRKHPYYEHISKLDTEKVLSFLTEEGEERLRFVSLGEAFDFISYGGMNYVVWDLDTLDMLGFTRTWIDSQKPRIEYEEVPVSEYSYRLEEKSREHSYLWNRFEDDFDKELPYLGGEINISLENVLNRLNCNHAFNLGSDRKITTFPFSGFMLASYVKAWWNQEGKSSFYLSSGQKDDYRVFPDFRPISSED